MINKNNTRIQITITKKMAAWIKEKSKQLGMQPSAFINWLIAKNIYLIVTKQRPEEHEKMRKITQETISQKKWNDLFPEETQDKKNNEDEEEIPF